MACMAVDDKGGLELLDHGWVFRIGPSTMELVKLMDSEGEKRRDKSNNRNESISGWYCRANQVRR